MPASRSSPATGIVEPARLRRGRTARENWGERRECAQLVRKRRIAQRSGRDDDALGISGTGVVADAATGAAGFVDFDAVIDQLDGRRADRAGIDAGGA